MTTHSTLKGGEIFPTVTVPKIGGGQMTLGGDIGRWSLVIVYRGKHCGRCKKYLNNFEKTYNEWQAAGFDVSVVSADPLAKVEADIAEFGWTFDIGYDLSEADMVKMGTFISDPLTPDETDRRFAEPAIYCLRPDGTTQIAAISNGPSARPDLAELLDGMIFTINNEKPARGMV